MQNDPPKYQLGAFKRVYFLSIILFFACSLSAQQKSPSKVYLQKKNSVLQLKDSPIPKDQFFNTQKSTLGLTDRDEMKVKYARNSSSGHQHTKYEQFHQGIPVFGSAYNLHTKDGKVHSANGYYLPLINLNTQPTLSASEAVELAIEKMQATTFSWEDASFDKSEKFGKKPDAELYIVSRAFPKPSEQYALAYVVEIFSAEPLDQQQYFIDAHSGDILFNLPLLKHVSVPAQGVTKYYGEQTITVDSIAPNSYLLQDLSRGEGVITRNNDLEVWTNDSNYWDFTNADQDEVAIDAHYCALSFYDYLLETFDWSGLGGNGEAMETRVHAGNFVNAFWNGEYAAFGDGDCNHGPLTTMEVMGHEFAHGLTDYTSDLIYSGESGAINESLSDVFGKALEYYKDPAGFDWFIGESFKETNYTEPFRSMEDPNLRDDPKFYDGEFWTDGGGVHTNSGVGNHWFYLLVEGKAGVNEIGQSYSVEGLGMDKAMDIVFLTQSSYLTANSTYLDYYEYSKLAAGVIYGENSAEQQAVEEAWKAVGLPGGQSNDAYDMAIYLGNSGTFVCGQNVYYSVSVTIANVGTIPYNPATSGRFEVNIDYVQLLNEAILPGESMTYVLEDYIFLGEGTLEFLDARLANVFDDNTANDQDFSTVENGIVDFDDMGLEELEFVEKSCHDNMDSIRFRVINQSCNSIPSGTITFKITDSNSAFTYEDEVELPFSLRPGNARFFYTRAEFPDDITDFKFEIIHDGDTNLDNNSELFFYEKENVISEAYLTEVNDPAFDVLAVDGFTSKIYDLNGDTYFAASGISINPFVTICPDVEETFNNNFLSSSLSTCVDFSDWEATPNASFDLIQYRTNEDFDFPEIADLTAITQAAWKNENIEEKAYFNGQEEGEKITNNIDLPIGFKGRMTFTFTSRVGDINSDEFLDYDVNLFDNLTFFEEIVSTKNPNLSSIELYPNPGQGQYFIRHKNIPQEIWLTTIQGQQFMQLPVEGIKQTLNLQEIPDGYYFLQIKYADQAHITQPLIKLTR